MGIGRSRFGIGMGRTDFGMSLEILNPALGKMRYGHHTLDRLSPLFDLSHSSPCPPPYTTNNY